MLNVELFVWLLGSLCLMSSCLFGFSGLYALMSSLLISLLFIHLMVKLLLSWSLCCWLCVIKLSLLLVLVSLLSCIFVITLWCCLILVVVCGGLMYPLSLCFYCRWSGMYNVMLLYRLRSFVITLSRDGQHVTEEDSMYNVMSCCIFWLKLYEMYPVCWQ